MSVRYCPRHGFVSLDEGVVCPEGSCDLRTQTTRPKVLSREEWAGTLPHSDRGTEEPLPRLPDRKVDLSEGVPLPRGGS